LRCPGWWPTKSSPPRDEYLGPTACAECHASIAADQKTTPMAKACVRASDSKYLQAHDRVTYQLGGYTYEILHAGGGAVYSVSDGRRSLSATLGWAFGEGESGESYIFANEGNSYEGRVSYYPSLQALDFTPGHPHSVPTDLGRAFGRQLDSEETRRCFGCHNTASSTAGNFDPDQLIPGVTCEACHGPGAKHVARMREGRTAEGLALVLNPAKLAPADSVDFCGACHRTLIDVMDAMEAQAKDLPTVRFQPYSLEISRCWGKGDARITSLACHNPHQPLAHDLASYDTRCLSCHLASRRTKKAPDHLGAACPRATRNCVTCHMPKYEVPDTHAKFTDHWIRIVRSGGS
jgi:hypothetical protein